MGLLDGFLSLGRNLNKTKGEFTDETKEGVISDLASELTLDMADNDLIELSRKWKKRWEDSSVKTELERKQKENERYYLGDHYTDAQKRTGKRDPVDNLIFESLETFLPIATRQNPEPVVTSDKTLDGDAVAKKVEQRLIDIADMLRLKLKVKKAVRHWALYYLGIIKIGWSMQKNEIALRVIRPQVLILDADAITDECEYEGDYVGEYKDDIASDLISRFQDKKEIITDKVQGKLGTKLKYIEWWTPNFLFWELEGKILGKAKNPYWNYDQTQTINTTDEFGNITPTTQTIAGKNHFSTPHIPYAFLSIFNLGKTPFDVTTLIEQVLPTQDVINKRVKQIDRNADQMNAGAVVSGDAFTKEQSAQVGEALRKGHTIWVPRGNVANVYKRDTGSPLPDFVYQSLIDARNELRNIFGTTGLSSPGIKSEETVRGKILIKGSDTDRAALIVDHIEQLVDYVFNWIVQIMYVYYDSPHAVSSTQGSEMISNVELFNHPVGISVKAGSMIPKDRLTQRNEAVDLWTAGALDPITLFERLDDPNPTQTAQRLYLWKANPAALFPQIQQPTPMMQSPPTTPPVQIPSTLQPPEAQSNLLNQVPT